MNLTHECRALERPVTWIFVRHGQTEANRAGLVQGRQGAGLTEEGRSQASRAADFLSDSGAHLVLSSPLQRTMETAEIIAKACGLSSPREADALLELDTGVFTGKSIPAIQEEDPDAYHRFQAGSWEAVEGAESISQLEERAAGHWKELIRLHREEGVDIVISVSHGGMLQWIFRSSFRSGWDSWMPLMPVHNCGIWRLNAHAVNPGLKDSGGLSVAGAVLRWSLVNYVPG